MLIRWMIILVLGFYTGLAGAEERPVLKTDKDKISYSIGLDVGTRIKMQAIDVDVKALKAGIEDALTDREALLTKEEVRTVMTGLQQKMRVKAKETETQMSEKNKKEGEAFLSANKDKEGVIVLPNGLQYKVLKEGEGQSPKLTDTVSTHYRGTLIDGTVFDSSYERGEPASFPVSGVIAGWTEALQKMKVGSKWQLFIPSELAYKSRGAGQLIGPNAALIFEIELLAIQ